jgi:hypothetical protein
MNSRHTVGDRLNCRTSQWTRSRSTSCLQMGSVSAASAVAVAAKSLWPRDSDMAAASGVEAKSKKARRLNPGGAFKMNCKACTHRVALPEPDTCPVALQHPTPTTNHTRKGGKRHLDPHAHTHTKFQKQMCDNAPASPTNDERPPKKNTVMRRTQAPRPVHLYSFQRPLCDTPDAHAATRPNASGPQPSAAH